MSTSSIRADAPPGAPAGVADGARPKPMPTMRKSCHFCRSRKIRCSGQSICGACRERNIDCSYEREGAKGRPKGSMLKGSRHNSVDNTPTGGAIPKTVAASTQSWSEPTAMYSMSGSTPEPSVDTSIAAELQAMFQRLFLAPEQQHSPDGTPMQAFNGRRPSQDPALQSRAPSMTYESLYFGLAQELVEFLAGRFGSLGCHHLDARQEPYLVACLDHDQSTTMFDASPEGPSPLLEYDNHRIGQVVEVWFAHHPLAFIVSKTLLLRSLRNNAHDSILLAVILADAKCAQEHEQARAEGEQLFRWAGARLCSRAKDSVDLSLLQAMILLGWHELCTARARRAMCYFGWAGHVLPNLPPPKLGLNQINGIDVGEVALEASCNVHWLLFAITLWALMQTDSPIAELLPSAPTNFPPVDETASAVFRLDMMSDNLSTLPTQARMFRELWPLCHVASTTAHIYALYPRRPDVDGPAQPACWQFRTLWQLRHLSDPRQDLSVLCAKVRHVLLHALELIEAHVDNHLSQALVLSVYHTMIVHFLFPRLEANGLTGSSATAVPITDPLLADFTAAATALRNVMTMLHQPADTGTVVISKRPSSIADIFALGLDACGKALNALCARAAIAPAAEAQRLRVRGPDLLQLAQELHAVSQHTSILPTARARTCKKQLKYAVRSLEALQLDPMGHPRLPHRSSTGNSSIGNSRINGHAPGRQSRSTSSVSISSDLDLDMTCPGLSAAPSMSSVSSAALVNPYLPTPLEHEPFDGSHSHHPNAHGGGMFPLVAGSSNDGLGGPAAFMNSPVDLADPHHHSMHQPQFSVGPVPEEPGFFERNLFADELQLDPTGSHPGSPFKKDLASLAHTGLDGMLASGSVSPFGGGGGGGGGGGQQGQKDMAISMGAMGMSVTPLADGTEAVDPRGWIDSLASAFPS